MSLCASTSSTWARVCLISLSHYRLIFFNDSAGPEKKSCSKSLGGGFLFFFNSFSLYFSNDRDPLAVGAQTTPDANVALIVIDCNLHL